MPAQRPGRSLSCPSSELPKAPVKPGPQDSAGQERKAPRMFQRNRLPWPNWLPKTNRCRCRTGPYPLPKAWRTAASLPAEPSFWFLWAMYLAYSAMKTLPGVRGSKSSGLSRKLSR